MADAQTATATDVVDVAEHLRLAVNRLNRKLRQESLGSISPAQASMLGMAERLGTPTLGELAKAEQIQPPTLTKLVAQMEGAGLIVRVDDPTDRRRCRVKVTVEGRRELKRIRSRKTAYLVARLGALEPDARSSIPALVDLLENLSEEA